MRHPNAGETWEEVAVWGDQQEDGGKETALLRGWLGQWAEGGIRSEEKRIIGFQPLEKVDRHGSEESSRARVAGIEDGDGWGDGRGGDGDGAGAGDEGGYGWRYGLSGEAGDGYGYGGGDAFGDGCGGGSGSWVNGGGGNWEQWAWAQEGIGEQ